MIEVIKIIISCAIGSFIGAMVARFLWGKPPQTKQITTDDKGEKWE